MKHRTPRQIRLDAGFSQEDLASAIGIHQSTISRIERGLMRTSIIRILSIAEALHSTCVVRRVLRGRSDGAQRTLNGRLANAQRMFDMKDEQR
jgi:transcriptional regulator with XRE-family HTH domain